MKLDSFTINIDLTNDPLMSTAYYISQIVPELDSKAYIINYSKANIKKYFTIDEDKNNKFIENTKNIIGKLVFVDEPVINIDWIKKYLSGLSPSDFVFLIGAERLLDYKPSKSIFSNVFFNSNNSVHLSENENWDGFLGQLDTIYGHYQHKIKGLITNINADIMCRDIILNYLDTSKNMSIIVTANNNQDDELQLLQKELLITIGNNHLDESIKEIERAKDKLGDKIYFNFIAMSYYKAGNICKAIEIMDLHYNDLSNEDKLILADMCIITSMESRAEEILTELYSNDKYLRNLFTSIIRLYQSNNEKLVFWLEQAIYYDPENPAVIEAYASQLSKKGDFKNAANEFRRLGSKQNQQYYEIVARMNDILEGKIEENEKIISYINDYTTLYPNLVNEGNLRLANYFITYKDSYFLAYKSLQNSKLSIGQPKALEIVKLKLKIMKDEKLASKALGKLKPYRKQEDADIIAKERTKSIIQSIKILVSEKNGYLQWRDFLDCQNNSIWNLYAYKFLIIYLRRFLEINIESELSKSYLYNISSAEIQELGDDILNNPSQASINLIKLLRAIKSGNFELFDNFGTFNEFVRAILTPGEVFTDNKLKILCRYYISIIASSHGLHQEANNFALSLMDLYMLVDNDNKILCLYLALLSWGYSQYRLGRHSEGVLCIISSIEYCLSSNELIPFLEEGINIISRFIADDIKNNITADLAFWEDIINKVDAYNENLKIAILMDDKDQIMKYISSLEEKIESESNDVQWAGDVVNLVASYMHAELYSKAVEILNKYGKTAILLLEARKDIRYEVLYNWSFIYFTNATRINDFFFALEIIELANKDLDEKRMVSHREERASIGSQSTKIYRLYIDICSTILHLIDDISLKRVMQGKIEEIVSKLMPRSIVEQKNYYKHITYSQEAIEIERQYQIKLEEYKNMMVNDGNSDLLLEKAKILEDLRIKLQEIHPHYMSLKEYHTLSFEKIQEIIEEHEILFHCIVTTTGILTILISKNDIKLKHKYCEPSKNDILSLTDKFSEHMQQSNLSNSELLETMHTASQEIGGELLDFIKCNHVERIFFIPDFELKMFPLAAYCTAEVALLDYVASIVNMVDYISILNFKKNSSISGVANRVIGNSADPELKKIQNWLKRNEKDSFIALENNSDNLDDLKTILGTLNGINTIAIFSHGVSGSNAEIFDGAKNIEGSKTNVELEDIIDEVLTFENLILISCRAGSPDNKMIEEAYGTWGTMLTKFSGNIISCRWDVSTDRTIELINELFHQTIENRVPVDKALVIAQKYVKSKYRDPQFWAGVEFWIN